MQAGEAKAAFNEWAAMALRERGAGLSASVLGQIQSDLPDGSLWAIASDARTFWALGPDDVLRELRLDADNRVSSFSRPLPGRRITAIHTTSLVREYQVTEARQLHQWEFSVDGTRLLALAGTVYIEPGRPRDRPDRQQLLALALQEVAVRSAR